MTSLCERAEVISSLTVFRKFFHQVKFWQVDCGGHSSRHETFSFETECKFDM